MKPQAHNSIYRKPTCKFGDKAVELLKEKDIQFEDHVFDSKDEEMAFKEKHGVSTTPQIFFGDERIGGYSDLAEKLGEDVEEESNETSYVPVIAVFSVAALMALATSLGVMGFMGFALAMLATLKLMDIQSFVQSFSKYDLITQRIKGYGYVYPFAEVAAGLGFLLIAALATPPEALKMTTGILSLFVGVAGGISVFKAVYIDKIDLNCACVGGNANVPLGAVSFTENAMMAVMGLWVLVV